MKAYIISIVVTSILIALTELVLPQSKLKPVINTVFSLTLLLVTISPLSNKSQNEYLPTFSSNNQIIDYTELAKNYNSRIEDYYALLYKKQLLDNNLVAEKVIVKISNMNIEKIQIFLSNLVIPEENSHINNNVIASYVAEILKVELCKVEIYA